MSGQRVAYIRVSSLDQNVGRQLDGVAVDRTFTDTASGKDVTRPQLAAMLGFVREGDTVIVHSMDRLARNLEDLRRIVRELTARGVAVQFAKGAAHLHRRGHRDGHLAAVGHGSVRRVRTGTDR
jgi:DNA invertase Pin-like site-specific DNA recombinase